MLSLYKLEIFNHVAMEGSFSRAAERLLLSQPAVSQHIRDLEASLGAGLFVRGNRGVTLTAAGETLLDYTRCILRMVAEAEEAVLNLNQVTGSQITIGATPGAGVYLLPDWIGSFHQRFAGLGISLRTDTTARLAEDVTGGRVDLAFVEGELKVEPPLNALVLREIDLFVVVGREHRWWDREQVDVESLDNEPFITRPLGSQTRTWIDQALNLRRVTPQIVAEFDHPEAIRQAVASGMGVTILPEWGTAEGMLGGRLKALPIEGVNLRRTLKLLWTDEAPMKAAARAFLAHLTEEFPQFAQLVAVKEGLQLSLPPRQEYRASLTGCVKTGR